MEATILTDAKGRPFRRPEPAAFATAADFVRATHAHNDAVASCANQAFDGAFSAALSEDRPNVRLMALGGKVTFEDMRQAIVWEQRSVRVFGKLHPQPRLTKWYGEVAYTYSGLSWAPEAMPELVDGVRRRVEAMTGERFNSVLCNLYRDGSDCVGWHADDEPIFGGDPVVASVTFGAARTFKLRRNDGTGLESYELTDGSLLVMGKGVQPGWKHSVPRTSKPCGERINLTFRRTIG